MLIALEGAPAVGKSTTSQALVKQHQVFVVPEVNKLFARPQNEPEQWYLNRQVARWEVGLRQVKNCDRILFDGDLFQPLWFSWIYPDEPWTPLEAAEAFYQEQIVAGRLGFPDVYFILWTSPEERRQREYERGRALNQDDAKIEAKVQRYEQFASPQLQYFKAFQQLFPERVQFVQSSTVEENVRAIASTPPPLKKEQDLEILDRLVEWLRVNKPKQGLDL
ncbi:MULTISPECIES: hypothetical protein [unclassified Leptolyngbya]|uniref:hypothetical protein n=1 Tax=unclassified Leptolyngbya TaxID=2650499 RepID=UPI001685F0EA|nr:MULTISPECIES: hypothetical protein [unclassified Leptolyngbya]MBD1913837.1 hypothetical protein [Leptolyngbya sp. FACHB-8]MBD2157347.1 hypothetical protein [Leptolyngbya sp. FACHB-16]